MFCETFPKRYECMRVKDLSDETILEVCEFLGCRDWVKSSDGFVTMCGVYNEITEGGWVVKWGDGSSTILGTAHSEDDFLRKFRVVNVCG